MRRCTVCNGTVLAFREEDGVVHRCVSCGRSPAETPRASVRP